MFLAPFIGDLTCGPAGGGDRSTVGYSLRGRAEWILYAERVVQTPRKYKRRSCKAKVANKAAGSRPHWTTAANVLRACSLLTRLGQTAHERRLEQVMQARELSTSNVRQRVPMLATLDGLPTMQRSEAGPYGCPSSFRALFFMFQMKV
jgi:hypothetical protein